MLNPHNMKPIRSLLIIFLALSCNHKIPAPQSAAITVITDQTDPHALAPVPEPILALYGFGEGKDKEAFFRLCAITDKKLNPVKELHLPDGTTTQKKNTLDQPLYRERCIQMFYTSVRLALSDSTVRKQATSSLGHSEVFYTVSHELSLLAKRTGDRKVLLVFSDLQENSDLFTCYRQTSMALLRTSPDSIAAIFERTGTLPHDLTGITVFCAFAPESREADNNYMAMVSVYKKLLEKRGARIIVQAHNTSYTL
jgi:hypothetical protein